MIEPGATMVLKPGFNVQAFYDRIIDNNEFVYCQPGPLSSDKFIIIKHIANGFLHKTTRISIATFNAISLWSCLSGGKEVWVSNLEWLDGIAIHAIDDT